MRFTELIDGLAELRPRRGTTADDPANDPDIADVTHDSRRVSDGSLFVCIPGEVADGHDFAPQAIQRGAVALLGERPLDVDVPQALADDARAAMAPVADRLWDAPSQALTVVGVTGTSGKTTVTHLVEAVFEAAGRRTEVLGTLSGAHTTPESSDLQRTLAEWRDDGVDTVAMEVSSHGLALHRVDATWFSAAVFTNLGHDHLDFHGTVEEYAAAKLSLFAAHRTGVGVVCRDDAWGRELLAGSAGPLDRCGLVGYGIDDVTDLVIRRDGSSFRWMGFAVELGLIGRFNVLNAIAAATVGRELGLDPEVIAEGLSRARPVRGRFELVPLDGDDLPAVVVDYAHKPEALSTALGTAREVVGSGRIITVFGCGGDRDREKRPMMGRIATTEGDVAVITSDNPRSEDPAAIIDDIVAGADPGAELVVEPDRRAAIGRALDLAGPDDLVLIAGKGHETTQVVGDRRLPFDDTAVAWEEASRRA